MATKFKFILRGGVRVVGNLTATGGASGLPGGTPQADYSFAAGTLIGVAAFTANAREIVPAVLSYSPVSEVWDFARKELADAVNNPPPINPATATALNAIRNNAYEIGIVSNVADGNNIRMVFAPDSAGMDTAPMENGVFAPPPINLFYNRIATKNTYNDATDPADGAIMAQLVVSLGPTPWAMTMAGGDMIVPLVPRVDGFMNLGEAAKRLLSVYAGVGDFSSHVKVGGVVISDNGERDGGERDVLMPNAPVSGATAASRRIALAGDIRDGSRGELGARNVVDKEAVASSGGYPLVGGDYGDLISIISYNVGSGVIFAQNKDWFKFIVDENGNTAFNPLIIGDLTGNEIDRRTGSTNNIATAQQPGGIPALVQLGAARMVNIGLGYIVRFGVIEGGSALPDTINTAEKFKNILKNAANNEQVNFPAIGGNISAQSMITNHLGVMGAFVLGDVVQVKNNMTSGRAPLPSDNLAKGYAVGASWFHASENLYYVKVSEAAGGAAVWDAINKPGCVLLATGGNATTSLDIGDISDYVSLAVVFAVRKSSNNFRTAMMPATVGAQWGFSTELGHIDGSGLSITGTAADANVVNTGGLDTDNNCGIVRVFGYR